MASIVKSSIEYFADPTKGRPVANGFVYVGTVDLDPEVPANQKQISVIQEDGTTVEVPQPLSLSAGGVPVYSGGYVAIVVDGDYSLKVNNKHGAQVYYIPKSSALAGEDVVASVDTIQELRDSDLHILAKSVDILGYTTKGDGGGGPTRYLSDVAAPATYVDNGSSIIVPTGGDGSIAWLWGLLGTVNARWFGVLPVTGFNNYTALGRIASALEDNMNVEFDPGIFEIEFTGGYDISDVNGVIACNIKDVKNVKISGNKSTIIIDDHDITASNGLRVFGYDGVQNLEITGFEFDLSYTGRNDSASYYPFCGAIVGFDTSGSAGSRTSNQLSSNINIHDNVFNIYHPLGCFAEAVNTFPGDPNNGFKIYSFTAFGDHTATATVNQNFDVSFYNNKFLSTHNAYGFWAWAYNAVKAYRNVAELWGNYATDSSGVDIGSSIPVFRYHQFYCAGIDISHNSMTPRAESDRTGGYQGRAVFAHITTNLTADVEIISESVCCYNTMQLRTNDVGILGNVYGSLDISNNIINGIDVDDRPNAAIDLQYGVNGEATCSIYNNKINKLFSGIDIRVNSGASVLTNRRLKKLVVKNNEFLNYYSSAIFFVNAGAVATFGIEETIIENNLFDGSNSEFVITNPNGACIQAVDCTEATDNFIIRNNIIKSFYNLIKAGAYTAVVEGNEGDTITSSSDYNYLPANKQVRSYKNVAAGVVPRIGTANTNFFNYFATRIEASSGIIQDVLSGSVGGGSSIATATPSGQYWVIDQTLIASKVL